MLAAKRLAVIVLVAVMELSCQREKRTGHPREKLAAILARGKGALTIVWTTGGQAGRENKPSSFGVGFFVSEKGTAVTAAHVASTTCPVLMRYESKDGSLRDVPVEVIKYDGQLDLALLRPTEPIHPGGVLKMDLENEPAPGQSAALLTILLRQTESLGENYFVPAVSARSVFAVFDGGLFATDLNAFRGGSGSPIMDLATERVIGVVVQSTTRVPPIEYGNVLLPMPDGTTLSVRAPYIIQQYVVVRSLVSARAFFSEGL